MADSNKNVDEYKSDRNKRMQFATQKGFANTRLLLDDMKIHFDNLVCFAGSLAEYEQYKGYKCKIVAPLARVPFYSQNSDFFTENEVLIYNERVEALVNYTELIQGGGHYRAGIGLPVVRD